MKKVLVVILMIFAVACAKKYVAQPEESLMEEKEMAEEVQVEEKFTPKEYVEAETPDITTSRELPFEFKDTLYDFDKYTIRPDARAVLDATAEWLNKNKHLNILIEGHCDERGTNEYNLALGEKRAGAARNYLLSRGIARVRIQTISYGEEKPTCTQQNEFCWQKNRRAHFVVMK